MMEARQYTSAGVGIILAETKQAYSEGLRHLTSTSMYGMLWYVYLHLSRNQEITLRFGAGGKYSLPGL